MTFRPDTPLGGPGLRRFSDSIGDMFRRILPFPLKLFRVATADQPTAADYEGAIDYDSTVSRPAYSDGSNWTSLMPYTAGEALTRVNDTNVTLTLGGTPLTALLKATSLTLGWTGQLAASRGGTGVSSLGDITRVNDTNVTLTLGGTPTGAVITSTSFTLGWTGTLAASRGGTGVASLGNITKADDTNVTLTLGGTPTGAVITSTSFTLGWTGTLAVARGGTGAATAGDARTNLGLGTAAVKDYAENTFTPTLLFGGGNTGMTGTFTGRYTTFARLVFIDIIIILTAKGSSTGAATIGNLPFTAAAAPGSTGNVVAFTLNTVAAPNAAVAAGTTTITLRDFTGSTSVAMNDTDFNNTSIITLSLVYST
jgi:hypothetical protein